MRANFAVVNLPSKPSSRRVSSWRCHSVWGLPMVVPEADLGQYLR